MRSANIGFGVGRNRLRNPQKPGFESVKCSFEIGKNRFWDRQTPVLGATKIGLFEYSKSVPDGTLSTGNF